MALTTSDAEYERQDELERCRGMIVAIFYGKRESIDYFETMRILMATGMPNEEARRFIDDRDEE